MTQQERIKHLLQLIQENPDLPIIPMVDTEVVCSDDFGSWLGSWGNARLDEYYHTDDRVYFREYDEEDLEQQIIDDYEEEITDEELEKKAKEIVASYEWIKCIAVRIELP